MCTECVDGGSYDLCYACCDSGMHHHRMIEVSHLHRDAHGASGFEETSDLESSARSSVSPEIPMPSSSRQLDDMALSLRFIWASPVTAASKRHSWASDFVVHNVTTLTCVRFATAEVLTLMTCTVAPSGPRFAPTWRCNSCPQSGISVPSLEPSVATTASRHFH